MSTAPTFAFRSPIERHDLDVCIPMSVALAAGVRWTETDDGYRLDIDCGTTALLTDPTGTYTGTVTDVDTDRHEIWMELT